MITLFDFVKGLCGEKNATLKYVADVKLKKGSNLLNVTKEVICECILNKSYEDAVNEALTDTGHTANFQSQSLPWGVWEIVNLVISHKGNRYLRYYCKNGHNVSVAYYINGRSATPTEVATIKAYAYGRKSVSTQESKGLDEKDQIKVSALNFNSILSIRTESGEEWRVNETESVA